MSLELTKNELLFYATLLEEIGDKLGNNTCNDLSPSVLANLSPEELSDLTKKISIWNSGEEEDCRYLSDYEVVGYLAHRLRVASEMGGQ